MSPEARAQAIGRLKTSTNRRRIRVRNEEGSALGWLVPITADIAAEPQTVETICRWRADNMDCFLTVFLPSLDKTRGYLTKTYLPDNERILFFVTDDSERLIGISGFCHVSADAAELDMVIRGEVSPTPHFMMYAQLAMLAWAFRTLDLPLIYLVVLENNVRARRAYERIGFRAVHSTPLRREETGPDEYRLVPDPDHGDGLSLLRMELNASDFHERHSFLGRGVTLESMPVPAEVSRRTR